MGHSSWGCKVRHEWATKPPKIIWHTEGLDFGQINNKKKNTLVIQTVHFGTCSYDMKSPSSLGEKSLIN